MRRRGYTLASLAAKCTAEGEAVSESQMSRIARGLSVPRPGLGAVLARLLDLDAARAFERAAS